MDIHKPVLMGRLLSGRQLEKYSWNRRKLHKCYKAKYKSRKAAMLSSAAYLNITSFSSLHPGHKQFTYVRYQSSKSQNSKRESGMSTLYNTAVTIQKKIMDGIFTPILMYSYQVLPKLSARDLKVGREKTRDQGYHDSGYSSIHSEEIDVKQGQNRGHIENSTVSQTPNQAKAGMERLHVQNVTFESLDSEKKAATLLVELPSLKKDASVSALTEVGLSRWRKFTDAAASENHDSDHYHSRSHSSKCITNTKEMNKNLECSDFAHRSSSVRENMPSADEFVPKDPILSSRGAYNIFKKLGFMSSSSAYSPSQDGGEKEDNDNNGLSSITPVEYKTNGYVTQSVSPRIEKAAETDGTSTSKKEPGTTSYVQNNYNLKYIQVNLFRSPNSLLFMRKKEKPTPVPPSVDNTAYFDSDVPLLEMTEAMSSKEASGVTGESTPLSVADKSKRYAAVADKIKQENTKTDMSSRKPVKPVISKANIDARTKSLALGITNATSNASRLLKLERLCNHLVQYPESRQSAIQERLIPTLLKLKKKNKDTTLLAQVHQLLAQLGYALPVHNRGVRILSVDGGGSRGIIAIETLRELERQSGKPVHEMFDYIIGVSSGAVLVYLLAYAKASLDVCEQLFKEFSVEVFNRNTLLGTSKLFFSHAFYDTDAWMRILRSHMQGVGQNPAIEMSQNPKCPKVAAVATLMNAGPIKNYLFRNYNPPPNTTSFYQGSSKYQLCQGLRASSAAPGYFEEYKLDDYVFQDGGVLTNNPSALALHESKLLWPDTPIQCLVSLGTGRYDPMEEGLESPEYSSLKKKLYQIMISATDTESVHTTLQDLLPEGSYFRFNPLMTEDFLLDENRPEKLDQLQQEALDFVSINELRIIQAAGVLTREKSSLHKAMDWVKLQKDMYR